MIRFHQPYVPESSFEEVQNSETSRGWRYIRNKFTDQILAQHVGHRQGAQNHQEDDFGSHNNLDHNKALEAHLTPAPFTNELLEAKFQKAMAQLELEQANLAGTYDTKDEHLFDIDVEKLENESSKAEAECHLASLLENFLESPEPQENSEFTQAWLNQDNAQRQALSQFWEGIRTRHSDTLRRLEFGAEDIEADLKVLSADSSPDHLQHLELERDKVLDFLAKVTEKETKKVMKAPVAENQQMEDKARRKVRVKTRVITESEGYSTGTDTAPDMVEEAEPEPLRAVVNREAFSIFQAMFPGSNKEDRMKTVRWSEFVKAMANGEVGFVARDDAGGSEVDFEPNEVSKWKGMKRIKFHKPHGKNSKIKPNMLQDFGNRLNDRYKWNRETFVLKE
jgi:hypothetical protein